MLTARTGVRDSDWKMFITDAFGEHGMPDIREKYRTELLNVTTFKDFLNVLVSIREDTETNLGFAVFDNFVPSQLGPLDTKMVDFFKSASWEARFQLSRKTLMGKSIFWL
jgi:hypothetical protein